MRFMIMHKTDAHWESGATPGPALIARVGALIGELAASGILQGAEGLRASSQGVRLTFSGAAPTITSGPFKGDNELPAGFSILRASSMDEAIDWATRQAQALGDSGDRHSPRHRTVGHRDGRAPREPHDTPLHGPAQGHGRHGSGHRFHGRAARRAPAPDRGDDARRRARGDGDDAPQRTGGGVTQTRATASASSTDRSWRRRR